MTKLAGTRHEQDKGRREEGKAQDLPAAGLSRRFIAYLVDWYIGGLATSLPISAIAWKLYGSMQNQNIMSFPHPYGVIVGLLALGFALMYYAAVPILCWRGQTLGKRWLKLKIVDASGSEATAGQLLLRQVVGIIIVEGSLVSASAIWHQLGTMLTGVDLVTVLMYAGMGISIVCAVLVLVGKHRATHAFLGGTKVVLWK